MARTMHAAVVEKFAKPLVFREWAVPEAGPGQILVKTEACGVCHTDIHAANGDGPSSPSSRSSPATRPSAGWWRLAPAWLESKRETG